MEKPKRCRIKNQTCCSYQKATGPDPTGEIYCAAAQNMPSSSSWLKSAFTLVGLRADIKLAPSGMLPARRDLTWCDGSSHPGKRSRKLADSSHPQSVPDSGSLFEGDTMAPFIVLWQRYTQLRGSAHPEFYSPVMHSSHPAPSPAGPLDPRSKRYKIIIRPRIGAMFSGTRPTTPLIINVHRIWSYPHTVVLFIKNVKQVLITWRWVSCYETFHFRFNEKCSKIRAKLKTHYVKMNYYFMIFIELFIDKVNSKWFRIDTITIL